MKKTDFNRKNKKRVFLDFASGTPMSKKVKSILFSEVDQNYNPSSLYKEGVLARKKMEDARKSVATLLRARPQEIIFTSSGTESNNMVIQGVFNFLKDKIKNPHIIISAIEHTSILEATRALSKIGANVEEIYPDENGVVNPREIAQKIREETILVSVMHSNNETGVIQPIKEIAREIRKARQKNNSNFPYFHTDACQSVNHFNLDVSSLGVDFLTLDGAKFYGPRSAILYKKSSVSILPIIFGGGQEKGIRSGTENVASVVGLSESLSETFKISSKEAKRLNDIREYFEKLIILKIPNSKINGKDVPRIPSISSVSIKNLDAEFAVIQMDKEGFAISSGSACLSSKEDSESYAIKALGRNDGSEKSTLRFSFGRSTTKKEVKDCVEALSRILYMQYGSPN